MGPPPRSAPSGRQGVRDATTDPPACPQNAGGLVPGASRTTEDSGPPAANGSAGQGSFHFWLVPPWQSQITNWVPLVVLLAGTSRLRPDWTLLMLPSACGVHCWLVPP